MNSYLWDRANRLLSMGGVSYTYNGDGNRVQQDALRHILDLQPGLAQVIGDSNGSRYIHSPRGIHAMQKPSGAWSYASQDGLGSVRQEVDAVGMVLATGDYQPFGALENVQGMFGLLFKFTGEPTDGNKLVHLRKRYLNPILGVFPSLDPFEGMMDRPMSLNGYAWVEGNVPNNVDPSGMCVQTELCERLLGLAGIPEFVLRSLGCIGQTGTSPTSPPATIEPVTTPTPIPFPAFDPLRWGRPELGLEVYSGVREILGRSPTLEEIFSVILHEAIATQGYSGQIADWTIESIGRQFYDFGRSDRTLICPFDNLQPAEISQPGFLCFLGAYSEWFGAGNTQTHIQEVATLIQSNVLDYTRAQRVLQQPQGSGTCSDWTRGVQDGSCPFVFGNLNIISSQGQARIADPNIRKESTTLQAPYYDGSTLVLTFAFLDLQITPAFLLMTPTQRAILNCGGANQIYRSGNSARCGVPPTATPGG